MTSLPQGAPEGIGKGSRVRTHLPLVHDRLPIVMDELDGILYGNDVTRPPGVDNVDHRCQGGRLPTPRWPRHQYKPSREHRRFQKDWRKTKTGRNG